MIDPVITQGFSPVDVWRFMQTWGLVPTWGIFFLMIGTFIKTYPLIQKNLLDARERRESRYSERITHLEKAVRDCQTECEDHKEQLRKEIIGMRRQHVQEQISLIAAIIESVDNPLLKQLMSALQSVQHALPDIQSLGEVTGDAGR